VGGEEVSELIGQPGLRRRRVGPVAEVGAKPCCDLCHPGLCVEGLLSGAQGSVQSGDRPAGCGR
jgi:hypothetical protein